MARPDKVAVVDRVSDQLDEAAATLLTDYRGLSVPELAELRAELRKVDATYHVVKNTLTRLAAQKSGMTGLDELLTGPTALVFCGEDPVGPAKALKEFGKEHEQLAVKGGWFEGELLDADAAMKLADLASREELLATLAGMMNNALAGFARLMQAKVSDMARLMAALEADGGVEAKGFSPSAPVESAASEEPVAAAQTDDSDDVAAEADDADVASADSSDSPESVDSPESDDSDDADDDAPGEPAAGAGETIDQTDAVEQTEADDDLRDTAPDVEADDEASEDDAAEDDD